MIYQVQIDSNTDGKLDSDLEESEILGSKQTVDLEGEDENGNILKATGVITAIYCSNKIDELLISEAHRHTKLSGFDCDGFISDKNGIEITFNSRAEALDFLTKIHAIRFSSTIYRKILGGDGYEFEFVEYKIKSKNCVYEDDICESRERFSQPGFSDIYQSILDAPCVPFRVHQGIDYDEAL